ncbi:MAG: hypothetical protein KGY70_02775 [Bacteroidales bacterium]|nr:hypothetical protein [Bacteroidales bacterium]
MINKRIQYAGALLLAIFVMLNMGKSVMAQHDKMSKKNTPLTQPGNDVFGTIAEVVQKLEAGDWDTLA